MQIANSLCQGAGQVRCSCVPQAFDCPDLAELPAAKKICRPSQRSVRSEPRTEVRYEEIVQRECAAVGSYGVLCTCRVERAAGEPAAGSTFCLMTLIWNPRASASFLF